MSQRDMSQHEPEPTPSLYAYGQSGPTRYQIARDIRRAYPGANLRISIYDTVLGSYERPERATARVILETARIREGATVTRITHKGTRTIDLIQVDEREWQISRDNTVWYKLDEPVTIQELGQAGRSITDWLAHVAWQRDAYRPGMPGSRLGERDSYARTHLPARGQKHPTPGGRWNGE